MGNEILIGQGLNEGAVELTTIRAFNSDVSSTYCGKTFNYDTTNHSYIEEACIVNQLEYIMNSSINEFVINGNDSIFKEFYQKYGLNTFIKFRFLDNTKLYQFIIYNQYIDTRYYYLMGLLARYKDAYLYSLERENVLKNSKFYDIINDMK